MRRLLLVLVLANVLVFGWSRGWFGGAGGSSAIGPEENAQRLRPVPLSRLVAPERAPAEPETAATPASQGRATSIPAAQAPQAQTAPLPASPPQSPRIAPSSQGTTGQPQVPLPVPAAPPTPEAAPAAPASTPALPVPDAPPEPASDVSTISPPVAPVVCRAFAPIDEERALALRDALEQSGARVDEQRIEQGASYLVYLPPAASVDEAQQNLLDARRIGRDDAFVIQDGTLRLAVSLGLFRFESTARVMVEQLVRAGETRALVAPRPPITVRIALQASWAQAGGAELAAMLGSQFDAAVRDCS